MAATEQAARGQDCLVRSINWGPWEAGMVDATLKAHFQRSNIGLITLDDGAAFFRRELRLAQNEVVEMVAAASVSEPKRTIQMKIDLDPERLPTLRDHVIKGHIVLPVVIILEWLVRLGKALAPFTSSFVEISDLQVLSGITMALDSSEKPSLLFEIAEPRLDGLRDVLVSDETGRPRYRACLDIFDAAQRSGNSISPAIGELTLNAWPMSVTEAYEKTLFHGPSFASIATLEGVCAHGGASLLKRSCDLGWQQQYWSTDPAMLDGGLQLGLLWASLHQPSLVLPQKIGRLVQYRTAPEASLIRCTFRAKLVNEKRIDFDFYYATQDGELIAEIIDAEFYALGLG